MPFMDGNNKAPFSISRNLELGGSCCCPFSADLNVMTGEGKHVAGRVVQDYHCGKNYCLRCCQEGWTCRSFYDLKVRDINTNNFEDKYQMEFNVCCCGPHNNFCGGTVCSNDAIFNVYPYEHGRVNRSKPVGHIQKTYGADGANALCRCFYEFSNYVVEFPEKATPVEKGLFIAAVMNTEYVYFNRSGNEN